jgi:hypothetical protein
MAKRTPLSRVPHDDLVVKSAVVVLCQDCSSGREITDLASRSAFVSSEAQARSPLASAQARPWTSSRQLVEPAPKNRLARIGLTVPASSEIKPSREMIMGRIGCPIECVQPSLVCVH